MEWAVVRAVAGGINLVLLREKDLTPVMLIALANRLRQITRGKALLVISASTRSHIQAALESDSDGVCLSEGGVSVPSARSLIGTDMLMVGRSVHDLQGATEADKAGADFLMAGSVFTTNSHPGMRTEGPALIERIASKVSVPVLGVGGITAINASEVIKAGAAGVAMIRAVLCSTDPYSPARRIRAAVDKAYRLRVEIGTGPSGF